MKEENNTKNNPQRQEVLAHLRNAKELFVIISRHTKMPFVFCDPETFDDEVLLYKTEKEAQKGGKLLLAQKDPVNIAKLENRHLLSFYSNLFTMGVNALAVNKGLEDEIHLQLSELVKRPDMDNLPDGKKWVENPQFHLTALYFMQQMRKDPKQQMTEEMKEMQEELLVDLQRGKFLVAVEPDKGLPVLKQKDGSVFQPIFTDPDEFRKFNRENKYRTAVIEYAKIPDILAPEAKGVIVNPVGVNVPFNIARPKKQETK